MNRLMHDAGQRRMSAFTLCAVFALMAVEMKMCPSASAFSSNFGPPIRAAFELKMSARHDTGANDCSDMDIGTGQAQTRREALQSAAKAFTLASTGASVVGLCLGHPYDAQAIDINPFTPLDQRTTGGNQASRRATAYLVDSTTPPSLVPFKASREAAILKQLGAGSGTQKSVLVEDSLNLNNMMNKGVFGTIDLVKGVTGVGGRGNGEEGDKKKRSYDATVVLMGVDYDDTSGEDADLAIGLMTDIFKPRRGQDSAVALEFVPLSMQGALDAYLASSSDAALETLTNALASDGQVPVATISNQLPVFKFAKSKQISLIACAPEPSDLQTVRTQGLQNVDPSRRDSYVVDPSGFIAWTQDAKNKMYTDRSLLKDFEPLDEKDTPGNYFAERILVHETVATSIAKYAIRNPKTLVVGIAPIRDVRFLQGINGRIPRVFKTMKPDTNVDEEAITTILLNPSAEETLSKSKFLRLEIGTSPSLIQYQSKVADYLWFSTTPKVNMLPRMMNG